MREWRRYARFWRRDAEEVDDELEFHLDMRTEEYVAAGMSPAQARVEAERRFGDLASTEAECRRIAGRRGLHLRRREWYSELGHDLRYAVRTLVRTPGLTLAILLTLALGIGANTAIFTVVNGVLLRPLPFAQPDRLVTIYDVFPGLDLLHSSLSEPELIDLERVPALAAVAGYRQTKRTITGAGEPERTPSLLVTHNFTRVLGTPPALGRFIAPDEDRPGAPAVVVLSDALWRRRFGGDPGVVGRPLMLDGVSHTILGVMPRGFAFEQAELFLPAAIDRAAPQPRTAHYLEAVGRLRDGATLTDARTQLRTLALRLTRDNPDAYSRNVDFALGVESTTDTVVGSVRPALLILLAAVTMLLLVACANVASLLLVRAESRRRELAVRSALGAGRGRLVRQLLAEGLVLALSGGAVGLLLATLGVPALLAMSPESLPRHQDIAIDRVVCAATLLLAMATGLVFGLAPALQATGSGMGSVLQEGGDRGGTRARGGLRRAFVAVEVALAVVLVVGASLLLQSFWRLRQVEVGFRPDHVLVLDLALPETRYADTASVVGFYSALQERLAGLPGVVDVGAVSHLPLTGAVGNWDIEVEGRPIRPGDPAPSPNINMATPGYYRTLRIPMVRGRGFAPSDEERSPPVAVINQTMARTLWPGTDPVGRRFRVIGDSLAWMTIIGVAHDTRSWGLATAPRAEYTLAYDQLPGALKMVRRSMTLVLRTSGDPLALAGPARRQIAALDRDLAVANVRTLEQVVAESIGERRFTMLLLGLFGAVALTLALIGIYGVTAYGVAQRTREMGIRLALGAAPGAVRWLVLGEGMRLALVGLAGGVTLALIGTRALRSQLYGVSGTEPVTYLTLSAVLLLVALLATYLPARRATRVDPTVALREG
ncbi:MAG TPA: ABC transporter permease [Gemmatimonadales bacterium]|jgi:predicted permease|nr:ABC transporter permease [Gemmatimonadales bacterium]